jgi:hypothetical protein
LKITEFLDWDIFTDREHDGECEPDPPHPIHVWARGARRGPGCEKYVISLQEIILPILRILAEKICHVENVGKAYQKNTNDRKKRPYLTKDRLSIRKK